MNEFYAYIIENILRFYEEPFSTDLYSESLYGTIGIITIASALLFNIIFYYVINRPNFARWWHWLLIGGVHVAICILAAYFIPKDSFDFLFDGNDPYNYTDYLSFSLINSIAAFAFYVIWMVLVRWKSVNAKQTPFPH